MWERGCFGGFSRFIFIAGIHAVAIGAFPAGAGMNREPKCQNKRRPGVPRGCGDEPAIAQGFMPAFPTGVGMNRAQKGAKNSLKRVPHGCGDEPRLKLAENRARHAVCGAHRAFRHIRHNACAPRIDFGDGLESFQFYMHQHQRPLISGV